MPKGFKPKRKQFKLEFDDAPDMEGCEVLARRVPLGKLLEFQELASKPGNEGFREMLTIFASAIIAWNVEDDDDQPVAPNLDGLLSQEDTFVSAVMAAWQTGQAGVPAPLDGASSSGETSPDLQIPMTPLDGPSESLAS